MPQTLAIIFALPEEIRPILKSSQISQKIEHRPHLISEGTFQGAPIIFCQTSVGMANAHEGAEFLFKNFKPQLLLSVGYAGAAQSDLKTGDLILANEIRSETPTDCFPTYEENRKTLEKVIQDLPFSYQIGPLMTVWNLAGREAKISAGQKGSLALDMETAAIAAIAEKEKTPFISLRVVFDVLDEELPFTEKYTDDTNPIGFVLRNPKSILKIPKYFRMNQICQKKLVQVLEKFILL